MASYTASAIVLRRSDLGESDRILRLLTREMGRVDAVAKGSRRGGSRLSGATELFTHCRMQLAAGRSLDIVTQCEISESFIRLRGNLDTLARAAYLCELVDTFVEERQPATAIFDLLLGALYLLQRPHPQPDVIVHAFELHLLSEQGYLPQLAICVRCGADSLAGFSPSRGGVVCPDHAAGQDDSIPLDPVSAILLQTLAAATSEDLMELHPDSAQMNRVGRCMRWYVRFRADRDLKSAQFLDMLRTGG